MELTGTLKVKQDEVIVSEKFKKREFVIADMSTQFTQYIQFQMTQDRCSMLDPYPLGCEIRVFFNIRGREWTNPTNNEVKYFNTLDAWKIELLSMPQNITTATTTQTSNNMVGTPSIGQPNDDLPF